MKWFSYIRGICFTLFITLILSTTFFFQNQDIIIFQWRLEIIGVHNLNIPLILDKPGIIFSATVFFISANVLLFSNTYINEDKHSGRFLIIILLFILSINLLIYIPNLIFLLIGWDGLGLVRFLLVIHYNAPRSVSAGYITLFTNRVGDTLIIVSIPLLILPTLNLNPSLYVNPLVLKLIVIILTLAAMTKRAQVPFSSWLPAAIAAPTPISALVHSSTLVTAGVFLIYRFYPTLSLHPIFNRLLLCIASATILIAGLRAFKESDIKKIIALSTLRQLGVIIFSLAINLPELAYFHILTHATFKALLFIAAGNLITQTSHTQDLRQFGNIWYTHPLTLSSILVAKLSLIGFPFMAGFYSKDLIIEIAIYSTINRILFLILLIATVYTLIYSIRFIIFIFFNQSNQNTLIIPSRDDKNINYRLLIIRLYVLFRGPILMWNFLFPYIHPTIIPTLKWLVFILLAAGLVILTLIFILTSKRVISTKHSFFTRSMWFLSQTNSQIFIKLFSEGGSEIYINTDSTWLESITGQGLVRFTKIYSLSYLNWQNFIITTNFFVILILILLIYSDSLN